MRKLIILILLSTYSIAFSQKGSAFGFKGGLNYNSNGDLITSVEATKESPERNIGYHFGVFGKLGNTIYLRPEIVYTATKSTYDSGDFNLQKLDMPLLLGLKIIGPVSALGGPSLQYILDSEFNNITFKSLENDFSIGMQLGVALSIKKIGIDLRYERGFSKNEALFLNANDVDINRLDTRSNQLILGFSFAIN
ncbi:MAG: PorT family protein [Flavobacteriaceae bacterium]|nr:PorT family protein [Flavobacteriaceae bacterium]